MITPIVTIPPSRKRTCLLVCESEKPHAEHRVGVEHASLHDVGEVCDQVLGAGQEICRSVQEAADAQSGEQASVGCLVGNGQLVALAEFEGILKPDIVVEHEQRADDDVR